MVTGMFVVPEPEPEETGPVIPQDLGAEQSVIGGVMLDRSVLADVLEHVSAEDFYRPSHEVIFNALVALDGRGEPTDAKAVAAHLVKTGELARAGGAAYLHTCLEQTWTAANAGHFAKVVKERAILRRLVQAGSRIEQFGYAVEGGEPAELLDAAQAELDKVLRGDESGGLRMAGESLMATIDAIEELSKSDGDVKGVPTGFIDLDRLTTGIHPGQLIIVAGRPASGKSTLALDLCRSVAIHEGLPVAYFSLEMSREEINQRMLSAEATVALSSLRSGRMQERDWNRVARVTDRLADAPLYVDDNPAMTVPQIRAACRRLKQRGGLSLVVVDYLQLMSSGRRVESRQQEVSEFSRGLKLLAKELGVPLVAVSQLNRGSEQRQDKRPVLSDLRESGSLEQDCDIAVLVHRDDMYEKECPRAGEADFIVAKNRHGALDTVTVAFQGHYARFVDMARGTEPGTPSAPYGLRAVE